MSGGLVFLMPHQLDMAELRQKIGELFVLQESDRKTSTRHHFDTFDWRLYKAGMMLSRQGKLFSLADATGEILCTDASTRKNIPFWWDFQQGELQDRLRPLIEVRALTEQFVLSTTLHYFSLLNADKKTVLRLCLIHSEGQRDTEHFTMQSVLTVDQLRGYSDECRRASKLFVDSGLVECQGDYNLVTEVQAALSIDPQETDSKYLADLKRGETVGKAVRDICLSLRSTMLRNIPGTIDDIDSEFLHDLRVAVRRTRSLLSLLKKHLPMADIAHFLDEFKWVGNVTGPVRDLDVYLLKTTEYRALLPQELQTGLTWFFAGLSRQRKRELRALRGHLRSARFTDLLKNWEQYLQRLPDLQNYPQGKRSCRVVAKKIIRKRFSRILRDGGAITPLTSEDKLHELRIEGKKFRYILEFFRCQFNKGSVDDYLKQMKRLQNNLGDFNDISVQKRMLVQLLANLKGGDMRAMEMAAALGGLIVHLSSHQHQVRTRFEETFASFATEENIELFEKIFSDAKAGPAGESDAK